MGRWGLVGEWAAAVEDGEWERGVSEARQGSAMPPWRHSPIAHHPFAHRAAPAPVATSDTSLPPGPVHVAGQRHYSRVRCCGLAAAATALGGSLASWASGSSAPGLWPLTLEGTFCWGVAGAVAGARWGCDGGESSVRSGTCEGVLAGTVIEFPGRPAVASPGCPFLVLLTPHSSRLPTTLGVMSRLGPAQAERMAEDQRMREEEGDLDRALGYGIGPMAAGSDEQEVTLVVHPRGMAHGLEVGVAYSVHHTMAQSQ